MIVARACAVLGFVACMSAPACAADLVLQVVDKACWVEIFEDDNYDADDSHVKLQGPKEFASLKNVQGTNWADDIQSLIV